MLILASTTDKLQVVAGTASVVSVHASYLDNVAGAVSPGRKNTFISTTGATDIVAAPVASVQRNVKTLHIHNHSTSAAVSVTVQHTDGTTLVQLHRQTLQPNDTLQYIDEIGFGSVGQSGGLGGFTTGDGKVTLKSVAEAGWVMMNDGTIGSVGSGSSTRANADCQALFTLMFNNIGDPSAPLLTSTGTATTRAAQGTASAAWAANCRMTLPKQLGRSLFVGGPGAGLTNRVLGEAFGSETHSQTPSEMASHTHSYSDFTHSHGVSDPTHGHNFYESATGSVLNGQLPTAGADTPAVVSTVCVLPWYTGIVLQANIANISINPNGGGAPMNVMNPSASWNIMIKL